ncbi:FMN-binding protein [Paenibacillus rigui]|uniref:FMN-binding domain-containing protein n=1 Tax=Paenibacillus rigui TaxID=554312 RepID=A0A229UPX9_9BACL|nr:FMN-binding protein [Paenibacillus rigui]OXM85607.1 hypothetical protein CF651_14575 [Paenibacillus rigui]
MARMGNKWIALCTTAISIVYGAGYAVNNQPALLQEASAHENYSAPAPTGEASTSMKITPLESQETKSALAPTDGASAPLASLPQETKAAPVPTQETSTSLKNGQQKPQETKSAPVLSQEASTQTGTTTQKSQETKSAPEPAQQPSTTIDNSQQTQQAPKPAAAPVQETATPTKSTAPAVKDPAPAASPAPSTNSTRTNTVVPKPASKYKDGTFTGSGTNSFGTVEVSVSIMQDKITNVLITASHTRYPQHYIDSLPAQVVEKQSARISTVSGATRSSEDFIEAVRQALQKAQA